MCSKTDTREQVELLERKYGMLTHITEEAKNIQEVADKSIKGIQNEHKRFLLKFNKGSK